MKRRISRMIVIRFWKTCARPLVRRRDRDNAGDNALSTSCRPCHFSGSGRSDFREHFEPVHLQRRLAGLGDETRSLDADEIAEIEQFENLHRLRPELLACT